MSGERSDRPELTAHERALVERVAELYAAPPLSPSRRVRFDARLAERLGAARPRRRLLVAASLAVAASALVAVFGLRTLLPREGEGGAAVPTESTSLGVAAQDDDAILAMMDPIADANDALPEDYRAISALVIGE